MNVSETALPLEGMRVLELGHIVAGPTASLILADLGADVIKVENPDGGDQARATGFGFINTNRNKRSIGLDLNTKVLGAKLEWRLDTDKNPLIKL